ncbi:OB-fold nucleic acid binding domain-containing protein [Planosporangium flavigriseum]|uniref:DNA-binding protein n=2 Tax=Planosporangium flavigriseum TaxID=373681 RepID=A0A8J3LWJ6_9ACTN|nr:DNA-binding protein [Planosporangium flavigriseum]
MTGAGTSPAKEGDSKAMATEEKSSPVRRFVRRLFASPEELDAEELQRDAAQSGSTPACDVRRGQLVTVTGRLRTVVYTPRTNLPTLEADLYDGSDLIRLIWLGRRHIAGIEPGRSITARGRIAFRDDRKVIFNPYYELEVPRP